MNEELAKRRANVADMLGVEETVVLGIVRRCFHYLYTSHRPVVMLYLGIGTDHFHNEQRIGELLTPSIRAAQSHDKCVRAMKHLVAVGHDILLERPALVQEQTFEQFCSIERTSRAYSSKTEDWPHVRRLALFLTKRFPDAPTIGELIRQYPEYELKAMKEFKYTGRLVIFRELLGTAELQLR